MDKQGKLRSKREQKAAEKKEEMKQLHHEIGRHVIEINALLSKVPKEALEEYRSEVHEAYKRRLYSYDGIPEQPDYIRPDIQHWHSIAETVTHLDSYLKFVMRLSYVYKNEWDYSHLQGSFMKTYYFKKTADFTPSSPDKK